MGKHRHFKVKGLLYFLLKAETRVFHKTWKKRIFIVREKYEKTQTFQIYGFLKYFGWNRNPKDSKNMGKVNSHNIGKVWEKTNIQKYGFFKYFGWSRNPYNSQNMGKVNSHCKGKSWEKTNISNLRVS